MRRALVLFFAVLLLGGAAPTGTQQLLDQAQAAFDAGRYQEVMELLARLPAEQRQLRDARFLRAYAQFKLGHLARSEQLLETMQAEKFTARAGLLQGMVAFQRRDFRTALTRLEAVQATAEQPWADTAAGLLERVRDEGMRAEQEFATAIDQAKLAIEKGRYGEAQRQLSRADRAIPRQHLPLYYQGFIAYKKKRYRQAEELLLRALALEPSDGWSQYMLALTLAAAGDKDKARPTLKRLARVSRDTELRRVAGEALKRLDRPARSPRPANRLVVGLELGTGLDTNPFYVDEVATPLDRAGLSLQAGGRLAYLRPLSRALRMDVGLRALERGYARGGEGVEQTEVAAWAGMRFDLGAVDTGVYFNYALLLYGHEPLFSIYTSGLDAGYDLFSWLRIMVAARVSWRAVLDVDRRYLEALQGGGTAGVRLDWRRLRLELAYDVFREWAEPVVISYYGTETVGQNGGRSEPVTYQLDTDYSQLGHGPQLWARLRLPWKLELSGGLGVQWRHFVGGDTLTWETVAGAARQGQLDARLDVRLVGSVELSRQLPAGFEVALSFESLDNLSSLQISDPVAIDRNYSRRQLALLARWGWPPD